MAIAVALIAGFIATPSHRTAAKAEAATVRSSTSSPQSYADTILSSQPILYYRLDDSGSTAADSSGNGRAGAYQAGVTEGAAGALVNDQDKAIQHSDANPAVTYPQGTGLPGGNASRTIEAWVKTTTTSFPFTIAEYGSGGGVGTDFAFQVYDPHTLIVQASYGSRAASAPAGVTITDGAWHYVAITYSDPTFTFYLDGQEIGSGEWPGLSTNVPANGLSIGAFVGSLDEFAIYPVALSATQILAHYFAATLSRTDVGFVTGVVRSGVTTPVQGALVAACPTAGGACFRADTATDGQGHYAVGVPFGSYTVTATPPPSAGLQRGSVSVTVSGSSGVSGADITLLVLGSLDSSGGGVSVNGQTSGVPGVNWGSSSAIAIHGCPNGMANVTITGTDTTSPGTVMIKTVPLTETPAGSGTYRGTIPPLYPIHGSTSAADYVYCPHPTAVLPYAGPQEGGTTVTIYGSGFTGATAVLFGSVPAASFSVISDSRITAVTPAGTGTVAMTVTTPAGTTSASPLLQFTYLSVTSISPSSGPTSGGGTVNITGTGFTSAEKVLFGSVPALYRVDSDTEITAMPPPQPQAGVVDVRIVTTGGMSTRVAADQFTYSDSAPSPAAAIPFPSAPPTPAASCSQRTGPVPCPAPVSQELTNAPPLTNTMGGLTQDPTSLATDMQNPNTFAMTTGQSPPDNSGSWTQVSMPEVINPYSGQITTTWYAGKLGSGVLTTAASVRDAYAAASELSATRELAPWLETYAGEEETSILLEDAAAGEVIPGLGVVLGVAAIYCTVFDPDNNNPGCKVISVVNNTVDALVAPVMNILVDYASNLLDCAEKGDCTWSDILGFSMFVDPSGTVVDTNGNPVPGATATMLASQTSSSSGPYAAPPSGSPLMQPSLNPETTDATGQFAWDVLPGYYEIQASKQGCVAASDGGSSATTSPLLVPPPAVDLVLTLSCPNEAPPPTPTVTGLSVASGPSSGGTILDVAGTGFSPGATIAFDGQGSLSTTVLSPTEIQAVAPAGSGTVDVRVTTAGGTSPAVSADRYTYISTTTDTSPPTTSASLSPASSDGKNGWYVHPVTLTLHPDDPDGTTDVASTMYSTDGGTTWSNYTTPISFTSDGQYTVLFYSTDHAGNRQANQSISFKIDRTPPAITCTAAPAFTLNQTGASISASVKDSVSGATTSTVSGAATTTRVGSYTLSLAATDNAGNTQTVSCSYVVTYEVKLLYNASAPISHGTTVLIRVELTDAASLNMSSQTFVPTVTGISPSPGVPAPTGTFSFVAGLVRPGGGYQYYLYTTGYQKGSYNLLFTVPGDPITHQAPITLS